MSKKQKPVPSDSFTVDAVSELDQQRHHTAQLKADRDVDLAAQRSWTHSKAGAVLYGLVMEKAFANSIRALGYKNTMYALAELIDNSIQAGSNTVNVLLHCERGESVSSMAIVDDGHGMDPDMIQIACLWGGTHREGDRTGFGRYGFGGPSSCASQGRRFTYYSRPADRSPLYSVAIDIDEIVAGKLTGPNGMLLAPAPVPYDTRPLPPWLLERGIDSEHFVGTIVVIDKLDRLSHKTRQALTNHLVEGFGVTYRNYLREVKLVVNDRAVAPVDPTFTTPGFWAYDEDDERAQPKQPVAIEVKGPDGQLQGRIRVRFSVMPPRFASRDKTKSVGRTGKNGNRRWPVLRDYNKGILVLRKGRQIDTIEAGCPWHTFVNYDRYWSIEVDFDPGLDEECAVTTSKQQVRFSERMWSILESHGVKRMMNQLKDEVEEQVDKLKAEEDAPEQKRVSEQAMEEAAPLIRSRPGGRTVEHRAEADRNKRREIKHRAAAAGLPEATVEPKVTEEHKHQPYRVKTESMPGAPFFRVEPVGDQVVVYLNTAHPFYVGVYAGPGSSAKSRAGLEVLLFVIGGCSLDGSADAKTFYRAEIAEWSARLATVVDKLVAQRDPGDDDLPDAE